MFWLLAAGYIAGYVHAVWYASRICASVERLARKAKK